MKVRDPRQQQLNDQQWAAIAPLFPSQPGRKKGFRPTVDNRTVFEAVLWRERVGCPWRDLPASFGPWHTLYMRWSRWVAAQVPQRVMRALHAAARRDGRLQLALALLDSTIVRAHQHAAGAAKKAGRRASAAVVGA